VCVYVCGCLCACAGGLSVYVVCFCVICFKGGCKHLLPGSGRDLVGWRTWACVRNEENNQSSAGPVVEREGGTWLLSCLCLGVGSVSPDFEKRRVCLFVYLSICCLILIHFNVKDYMSLRAVVCMSPCMCSSCTRRDSNGRS